MYVCICPLFAAHTSVCYDVTGAILALSGSSCIFGYLSLSCAHSGSYILVTHYFADYSLAVVTEYGILKNKSLLTPLLHPGFEPGHHKLKHETLTPPTWLSGYLGPKLLSAHSDVVVNSIVSVSYSPYVDIRYPVNSVSG